MGVLGPVPGLGKSPGGGHGNTPSILAWRIPMDRGAWGATVHGVAKSQTRLSNSAQRTAQHKPRPPGFSAGLNMEVYKISIFLFSLLNLFCCWNTYYLNQWPCSSWKGREKNLKWDPATSFADWQGPPCASVHTPRGSSADRVIVFKKKHSFCRTQTREKMAAKKSRWLLKWSRVSMWAHPKFKFCFF